MKKELFGKTKDGREVTKYTLENQNGIRVSFLDLGAVITNLWLPDSYGNIEDVVLGYDTVAGYEVNEPSFGALVGRCANRISNGAFTIDGKEYQLDQNDSTNCLHGGFDRFNYHFYDVDYEREEGEESLTFSRRSPDGEQHFPGNFEYSITYRLTDLDDLILEYHGVSDEDTVVNLTNHSYFNLGMGGHKCRTVQNQEVKVFASQYTPLTERLYPTGEIAEVAGTPLDFHEFKALGKDVDQDKESSHYFKGYDHNFVLDHSAEEIVKAVVYRAPDSRRQMTVYTDQPGIQIYTAPELDEKGGKEGLTYGNFQAVCFETQNYPNAVNTPGFPHRVLKKGEEYRHTTTFHFEIYD